MSFPKEGGLIPAGPWQWCEGQLVAPDGVALMGDVYRLLAASPSGLLQEIDPESPLGVMLVSIPGLLNALRALRRESIGDFIYQVRDSEMKGWDGPRVKAWGEACSTIESVLLQIDGKMVKR